MIYGYVVYMHGGCVCVGKEITIVDDCGYNGFSSMFSFFFFWKTKFILKGKYKSNIEK